MNRTKRAPPASVAILDFLADREMARFNTAADVGGCWETSLRFAWYCHRRGVKYRWRKWTNLPGYRTEFQHNIEVDGVIIDWIYRQYDANASWPFIEPMAAYQARFGPPLPICDRCGFAPHDGQCLGIFRDQRAAARAIVGSWEH